MLPDAPQDWGTTDSSWDARQRPRHGKPWWLPSAAAVFSPASWGSEPRSPGRCRVPFRVLSDGCLFRYILPRKVLPATGPRRSRMWPLLLPVWGLPGHFLIVQLCLLCGAFNFTEIRLIISSLCGVSTPSGAFATPRWWWCSPVFRLGSRPAWALGSGVRPACSAVRRILSTSLTDGFGLFDSEAPTARCLCCCGVLGSLASLGTVPQPHVSRLFGLRWPLAGPHGSQAVCLGP